MKISSVRVRNDGYLVAVDGAGYEYEYGRWMWDLGEPWTLIRMDSDGWSPAEEDRDELLAAGWDGNIMALPVPEVA